MNKKMRFILFVFISFSLLACSLGNIIARTREATPTPTATRTAEIPKTRTPLPSPSPTQNTAAAQSAEPLEICSLVDKADVETILAEPASEPKNITGSCVFTNAKDSLYMVTVAAGQDELAKGILEGQAMMMGFAGAPLDEARMAELKSLAASMDFKGFFSELVAAAGRCPITHGEIGRGSQKRCGLLVLDNGAAPQAGSPGQRARPVSGQYQPDSG